MGDNNNNIANMQIGVLGGGSWGTALANLLAVYFSFWNNLLPLIAVLKAVRNSSNNST